VATVWLDVIPRLPRLARAATGLLLVAVVLLAISGTLVHSSQHCLAHQDCLACRWSADSVVVLSAPPSLPGPGCAGVLPEVAEEASVYAAAASTPSRGPPSA